MATHSSRWTIKAKTLTFSSRFPTVTLKEFGLTYTLAIRKDQQLVSLNMEMKMLKK